VLYNRLPLLILRQQRSIKKFRIQKFEHKMDVQLLHPSS
jgi:hypothetical protein